MTSSPTQPKLLDKVRARIRVKHYSIRTEQAYVDWIKRFIVHFDKRHPRDLGAAEVEAFLTHLAVAWQVAASTQNQAKSKRRVRIAHDAFSAIVYQSAYGRRKCRRTNPRAHCAPYACWRSTVFLQKVAFGIFPKYVFSGGWRRLRDLARPTNG